MDYHAAEDAMWRPITCALSDVLDTQFGPILSLWAELVIAARQTDPGFSVVQQVIFPNLMRMSSLYRIETDNPTTLS